MFTVIACVKCVRSELITAQQSEKKYVINPYDLYMIERLIECKKNFQCRIIGVTMGTPGSIEAMQRGIAMGLDDVYLISDPCFSGSDTYATSYILSKALKHIGQVDLYTFGEKAIDGETEQVPIGVASHLDLHCITGVRELKIMNESKVWVKREFAYCLESIESLTPCALSFQGFTTREPKISLLKLKQARKYTPIIINADSLNIDKKYCGQSGSKTVVKNIMNSIHVRDVEVLEGTVQIKADAFRELIIKYEGG